MYFQNHVSDSSSFNPVTFITDGITMIDPSIVVSIVVADKQLNSIRGLKFERDITEKPTERARDVYIIALPDTANVFRMASSIPTPLFV